MCILVQVIFNHNQPSQLDTMPEQQQQDAADDPASTAAEEAEWEERTRPSRTAPRVNSMYLRKDYAAACPEQHIAYLHCLKEAKSWLPTSITACHDEYKAFAICKHRAQAANGPPPDEGPQPSTAEKLWADLQREPLFIAAKMGVQEWMHRLGLDGMFDSSSSSTSSSEPNSSSGSGGSSGGSSQTQS